MPADKAFYFKDLSLDIPTGVYEPKEDSLLLAENLKIKTGDLVLDMGTGSGLQAIIASGIAARVIAVDVNPTALDAAKNNAERSRKNNIEFRLSDLFSAIKPEERFDLIIFNPPYVPSNEDNLESKAWAGGKKGRKTIVRFIEEAPKHLKAKGRIMLLVSSMNDTGAMIQELEKKGLKTKITAKKKLWFEELSLLEAETG